MKVSCMQSTKIEPFQINQSIDQSFSGWQKVTIKLFTIL